MRLKIYALFTSIFLLGILIPHAGSAQKVKTSSEKVEVKHLRLPTRPLPASARTYSKSISSTSDINATLASGFATLKNAVKIPGYAEVPVGDVHVELIPSAFSMGPTYEQKQETTEKKKDGTEVKSNVYTAYVPAYLSVTMRVLAQGGEVLHEEVFGPSEGAPKKGAMSSSGSVGKYEGNALIHPSTTTRYDVKLDGSTSTVAQLKESVKKNWGRHVSVVRSEVVKDLSDMISYRLREMGFAPSVSNFKLPDLKEGHAETVAFNEASATLRKALAELSPGKGVEAAQASAAPALAYFQALYESSTGEDKQVEKLREAALENLVYGNAYLENFEAEKAILAGLSEKEQGKWQKDIPHLSRNIEEMLAGLPIDSRYSETFTEANMEGVAPSEADPVALFGLRSTEITDASRDEKIGMSETEEEFESRASGGKDEPMEFNGLASPRHVVTKGDGEAGLSRFLKTQDIPAILGDNVRGYVVYGADDVRDIDFNRLTYDSLSIGNRTFVKLDIKLNMIQKSLMTLPSWYEVMYFSPKIELYQQAFTTKELANDELASGDKAYYTLKVADDKYQHTNTATWVLSTVKSMAKYLDCPAVNDFVESASPAGHYYTYLYMVQLYDENCGK